MDIEAFLTHLGGTDLLHTTVQEDPSGPSRGDSRYVEYLALQTS